MDLTRQVFVLLVFVLVVGWGFERCEAGGKFSFDVHHMLSDKVRQNLGYNDVTPEKGTLEYFKLLANHDRLIRGRGLASNNKETPLTFMRGNLTLSISFLGFLHYANVSVGTPATWFMVALDTGSDLFWLPCNCGTTCIRDLQDAGLSQSVPLNLYSPNASSTSSNIRCSDTRCFGSSGCSSPASICPYQVSDSITTSSTGTLLEDVLHLITDDENVDPVKANVTLGCGQNQTGLFQTRRSVNGVLGLGMKDFSVPSILAKDNITANSFSLCFGRVIDIVGRISLGDKGYTDQKETPFIPVTTSSAYFVSVTGAAVGGDPVAVSFAAQIDSGSTFTQLMEPSYGVFTKAFDDLVEDRRRPVDSDIPFEFCYDLSPNATSIIFPLLELTFRGLSKLTLMNPFFSTKTEDDGVMYCLGVLKSEINVIGQNFMLGHRVVFDRERMILGWKRSNCFEDESLTTSQPPPPPPETEAPAPRIFTPPSLLPPLPPPIAFTPPSPPLVDDPRSSPRIPGLSGAVNLIPLASQLLLLLPLLAFL